MSNEKTVEMDAVDSRLEGHIPDPWKEMSDREKAERIEEIHERTPEKDLRVKSLEDRDMIEFSDISKEELNPESYSDLKNYAVDLLEEEISGADEKLETEKSRVREFNDKNEERMKTYREFREFSRKIRLPSALAAFPGTFGTAGFYAAGEPLLAAASTLPTAAFFASFPAELAFERKEREHKRGREYVRTERFEESAYQLFDAAEVVVASRDGDRNLFQQEALESYEILEEEGEVVHGAKLEDYHPDEDPFAVDLRVDAYPIAGGERVEEPAEQVQYVLVGDEDLKEAYKNLTREQK